MFAEPLLQSPLWQSFQEKNGKRSLRERELLLVVETLPLVGQYLYAPRGPAGTISNSKFHIPKAAEEIFRISKELKAGWVRVEPADTEALEALQAACGKTQVVRAPHDVQPREILVMNIKPSEAVLLAQMKSKTRYNIRLAEKHGVSVRYSRASEDMEAFLDLIYATTERKAIRPHPKEYYRNFFQAFDENQCVLAVAEQGGQMLAANLLVFFEGTAYYLHGGSSAVSRSVMAPFLLQFESMREAKRRGSTLYDFGGVNTREPQSAWSGITRFKQGFAPTTAPICFPGAYDIVISPWRYRLYRILQKVQVLKKKFR